MAHKQGTAFSVSIAVDLQCEIHDSIASAHNGLRQNLRSIVPPVQPLERHSVAKNPRRHQHTNNEERDMHRS